MKPSILIPSIFIAASLFISGCSACESDDAIQKENFIKANKELACETVKDPALAIETEESKVKVKAIFIKYDLPTDSDDVMKSIFTKFKDDPEVKKAVSDYVDTECLATP
jgi:hypothetical protein